MKIIINIKVKGLPFILVLLLINLAAFSRPKIEDPFNLWSNGCDNADFNFVITQGSLNGNCYYDIEFNQIYNNNLPLCDKYDLPHGIYLEIVGATISSSDITLPGFTGNTWLQSSLTDVYSGSNYIYWLRDPIGNSCYDATNAIPSNQPKKIRIWVNPTSNSQTVYVRNLTGRAFSVAGGQPPNNISDWNFPPFEDKWHCGDSRVFSASLINYSIGPDTGVCINDNLILNIAPAPPTGSTVEWYYSLDNPCPNTNPPTGWTNPPFQGNLFNTNYLTEPDYCFVAKIKTGCFTYFTNIKHISVCEGPPNVSITASPSLSYPALINMNGEHHACQSWEGELSLSSLPLNCNTSINWQSRTRYQNDNFWGSWSPWLGYISSSTTTSIQTGSLFTYDSCAKMVEYKVILNNECGSDSTNFVIVIDRIPEGGFITTLTPDPVDVGIGNQFNPRVCKETRLEHHITCGETHHWESREETIPCSGIYGSWTVITGSHGTSQWWTNQYPLTRTTQYRVLSKNGSCNGPTNTTYSNSITVEVIPVPTVTITTNSNLICGGSFPTLTANTNLPTSCITNAPLIYEWFKDGVGIPGANSPTYIATTPGNYYLIFTSQHCNKFVKSNIITICKPILKILGPCCICPDETIILEANITNMDACNGICSAITYQWFRDGNLLPGETNQQISITNSSANPLQLPSVYSVSVVICGTCDTESYFKLTLCPHQ